MTLLKMPVSLCVQVFLFYGMACLLYWCPCFLFVCTLHTGGGANAELCKYHAFMPAGCLSMEGMFITEVHLFSFVCFFTQIHTGGDDSA